MSTLEFYLERAQQARRDAEATTLDNVRDRALRAEAAWLDMAHRLERGAVLRETTAAAKAVASAEAEDTNDAD